MRWPTSNRGVQVLRPNDKKQLSLFSTEPSREKADNHIANLIVRRLGLPSDTVLFKHNSTYYYYVDKESLMAIDLTKFIGNKLSYNTSQAAISFINEGQSYGGYNTTSANAENPVPPKRAEQLLLLILDKKGREYLVGDLREEYAELAAKQGERFAKVWYYKQVTASAWPLIRKAVGWGLLASVGAWIRRII